MKRLFLFLFCVVIIMGFTACDTSEKTLAEYPTVDDDITAGDIYSDFAGVNIKIKEITFTDNESTLLVEWVNKTVYDVIYGESYAIERYENGKWVSCQKTSGEPTFHAIGICLNPTSTMEKTYSFFDIFDVSKAGKYRIITDCYVYKYGSEAKGQKCNLLAEFTVKK